MKNEKTFGFLMKLFLAVAGVTAYFSYFLGKNINSTYYFGFTTTIILLCFSYFCNQKKEEAKMLQYIMDSWGQQYIKKRHLKVVRRYFDTLSKEASGNFVDDQTWEDLNMNEIYTLLDRNLTTCGEQVLYNMLRSPHYEEAPLLLRNNIIKVFQSKSELRKRIQLSLYSVGILKEDDLSSLLWGKSENKGFMKIICSLAAVLPIFILLLTPILSSGILALLVVSFGINVYIHSNHGKNNDVSINSIRYLSNLVAAAGVISKLENETISYYTTNLKEIYHKVKRISKRSGNIGIPEGLDLIADYVRILFLVEERSYYSVIEDINNNREALKIMYKLIGEIDSLISIASYREQIQSYTEPKFIMGKRGLNIEGLVHPLVTDAVSNDIRISEEGVIITGSNMSGKSTFLRAVGLSTILAQTIYMVTADKYEGVFYNIMTSISPSDSVVQGKSYYLGEAEAILRIIKSCSEELPILCIVDEIFRGTNPIERISASVEILEYIIKNNTTAIVATHDLELTEFLKDNFQCYYFTEDVHSTEGLQFDYKIRKGVSNTRNAIRLLEYLGYPAEIVQAAEARIMD